MRVLVTGGAGYIGSHTVLVAASRGHDVEVLDSLVRGRPDALRRAARLAGTNALALHAVDLCDEDAVRRVVARGFDAVLHVAAFKSVAESVERPDLYERNNAAATRVLGGVLAGAGLRRLVYASTGAVYGEGCATPFRETDPQQPMNPYARTKAEGERIAREALPDAAIAALRFFNVCGAHESGELGEYPGFTTNLMPLLVDQLESADPKITVFGDDWPTRDGTCIRDYVHVMDVAEALVAALERGTETPGFSVYNVGTGRGYTVLEVIDAVGRVANRPIRAVIGARRPGDPAVVVADPSRAADKLGWRAKRDLDEMARSAVSWAREIAGRAA